MGASDVTGTPSDSVGPGRLWATALMAGIATAAIAWLIGEAVYKLVPSPRPSGPFGTYTAAELVQSRRADIQNALLAIVPLGAVLGAALGLAGGFARRSPRAGAVAAAIGLVVGAVAAVGATLGILTIRNQMLLTMDEDNLPLALATHGAIWSALGAAAGAALGLGLGGGRGIGRAALGGLLGAAGASVVFVLAGGLAFPLSSTHLPISGTLATRLLARILLTTLAAAGAVWAIRSAEPRSAVLEAVATGPPPGGGAPLS